MSLMTMTLLKIQCFRFIQDFICIQPQLIYVTVLNYQHIIPRMTSNS